MAETRAGEKVSLAEAKRRLIAWRDKHDMPLGTRYSPSVLAEVIWPDNNFLSPQGAARAATGVLVKLGLQMTFGKHDKGYQLYSLREEPSDG